MVLDPEHSLPMSSHARRMHLCLAPDLQAIFPAQACRLPPRRALLPHVCGSLRRAREAVLRDGRPESPDALLGLCYQVRITSRRAGPGFRQGEMGEEPAAGAGQVPGPRPGQIRPDPRPSCQPAVFGRRAVLRGCQDECSPDLPRLPSAELRFCTALRAAGLHRRLGIHHRDCGPLRRLGLEQDPCLPGWHCLAPAPFPLHGERRAPAVEDWPEARALQW